MEKEKSQAFTDSKRDEIQKIIQERFRKVIPEINGLSYSVEVCDNDTFYSIVKDVLRADEVYAELYPRERPENFDRNYVLEKEKEFKEIMAVENPYYSIYYSNKK